MATRINPALLSLCLSLCATSAMALPNGQRVTIDTRNGSASGTVVDFYPTTAASQVHIAQSTQNTMAQAQPQPSAANGQLKHKVGERVDYVDYGTWFKAIIISVRDDRFSPYRVHKLGYTEHEDAWVCCADFTDLRSQLRPAGSSPTEPVPGGEANDYVLKAMGGDKNAATPSPAFGYVGRTTPAVKRYDCVTGAPIAITGESTYAGGTYSFNSASSTLTFHGGNYDGQRAKYETSGGLPQLHILGPSGRPVIDCD